MNNQYTLIANSGIQLFAFQIEINMQDTFMEWFHEWYDKDNSQWHLDPVYKLPNEESYYKKKDLFINGYLCDPNVEMSVEGLKEDGILPIKIDDDFAEGVTGDIFKMNFQDKQNRISSFENQWIPLPYFLKKTEKRFEFGPLNWARMKLIPVTSCNKTEQKTYNVILAFDTRTKYEGDGDNEYPVFSNKFDRDMVFELCRDEFKLMDYCSGDTKWSYIDQYLMKLVHPNVESQSKIRGSKVRKTDYLATYVHLIRYLTENHLFPQIILYKDQDEEYQKVDMIVDIGNSRTTALLLGDGASLKNVSQLELVDYTNLLDESMVNDPRIRCYHDPFDMRLVFRKADFGDFGTMTGKQFLYPSFIRLGKEADNLIHQANLSDDETEKLCTYSSPKRFLWDDQPQKEEWQFLILGKESKDDHILNIKGLSEQLKSDGKLDKDGSGGISYHYSRRTLMTFAFLEMFVQALRQINSHQYRVNSGNKTQPRKLKHIIVTCPTAMSKLEREALVQCANDAVVLLENFDSNSPSEHHSKAKSVEVIPSYADNDDEIWYYDEATCSQLVYMYGEVGQKYKGCCGEFFKLYGKSLDKDKNPTLTVGSLDIGGGTSDLMISEYTYTDDGLTTITPFPKFYDSYYFAGDDMVSALIKNVMLLNEEHSAFRNNLQVMTSKTYRQKIKDFFGPDYSGQPVSERKLRRDFNLQYSIPLMYYFVNLLDHKSDNCIVSYQDVFSDCPPNQYIIDSFKQRMGIDVTTLSWTFNYEEVNGIVKKEFEPLLKKIATIMYACACDVVLLSGQPASIPAIRELLLKYYAVAPNRLIVLNNYYVGDWYPFSQNTGFIANPKTIVAIGGIIAHYSTNLPSMNKFVINLDQLKKNLKSTVNYIGVSDGPAGNYILTPKKNRGELKINELPTKLEIRQIGIDSYPSRVLYEIDFNRVRLADMIRKKAQKDNQVYPDGKVMSLVNDYIDKLIMRMPYYLSVERDADDKEKLFISSVIDKDGNDVTDGFLEINIQSLGVDGNYWLDTGSFDF